MAEQRRTGSASVAGKARPQGGGSRNPSGRPVWVFSEPPSEIVAELSRRFPKVIKLPEEEVKAKTEDWLTKGLVARSLGRRISPESAIREFRFRGGLKGDIAGFTLDNGFMLFRFNEVADRDAVINRPWSVNGSVLALEPWRARFVPAAGAIESAMVWVRLPLLPVELWGVDTLKAIVEEAGVFVALDDSTSQCRRLGFARAAVRVSLVKPLRPGALIDGPKGCRWQSFVYEQLTGICFNCGMFHCIGGGCHDQGKDATAGLQPENTVLSEDPGVGRPLGDQGLGPWVLAVRRWLPPSGKEEQPRSSARFGGSSKGGSGSGEQGMAGASVQRPVSAPDGGGWMKPVKVARRSSPPRPSSPVKGIVAGSYFSGLRAAGDGDPDPLGSDGLLPSVGPSAGSAGRFKRARPAPQLPGPAASERGKSLQRGGSELALVVQKNIQPPVMDVRSGQEKQLLERGKNKGKAAIEVAGRELSEFIFTAGGLKGNPTNPFKPIAPSLVSHPDPALLLSDQAHLAAVGRMRLAIEEDGDQSTMMEDTYEGVDEDREGGGSGVTPLSHQVSE